MRADIQIRVIRGSHGGKDVLGYDTLWNRGQTPMFRRKSSFYAV
jgi:hypothetical protein